VVFDASAYPQPHTASGWAPVAAGLFAGVAAYQLAQRSKVATLAVKKEFQLDKERLEGAVAGVLAHSQEKKRNFVETIELQIGLKDVDPNKDKVAGIVELPHIPRNVKVCILGNDKDVETAKALGLSYRTVDDLLDMNKDQKQVKNLANEYDAFLASKEVLPKVPMMLGPGLSKAGKFPGMLDPADDMAAKVTETQKQIKFRLRKYLNMSMAVGNVGMSPQECQDNIETTANTLTGMLKKNWSNVKTLHVKSTMGPPFRIYG